MSRNFWLGLSLYSIATFAIAAPWHLSVFTTVYDRLEIYRADVIVPLGVVAMLLQGAVFSWLYPRVFSERHRWLRNGLLFGSVLAVLAWAYMVAAVAAKHHMASVGGFIAIESIFIVVQFLICGPLIAMAHRPRAGSPAA